MKLVATARAPAEPEVAARTLAAAAGLSLAEARMRLAPEPPSLLARLEAERADAVAAALRKAGVAALALDARVPTDRDRTVAHAFALSAAGLRLVPRFGDALELAWPDVLAILRGARASRSEVERTEKSRSFSPGAAAVTGGLRLTKTTTRTVRSSEESVEQVVLVYARDGRAGILPESGVDFSCLGARMQPSSTANMAALAAALRDGAKGAFYDERLVRLGRRSLPFLAAGESRTFGAAAATARTDTSESLDVLAEALRQALVQGLLP